MCMIDYSDSCGVWLTRPHAVKARKPHQCQDCCRQIEVGELYWVGAWKDEEFDGIERFMTCLHCVTSARWLDVVCRGHLWGYDAIGEDLFQHWDSEIDLMSLGLGRLVIGRRWKWRRRGGELIPIDVVNAWVDDALAHVPEVAKG